jgi:dTDP-4-dehydrorhamnose reductase
MNSALVIGGDGFIGGALFKHLSTKEIKVFKTSRSLYGIDSNSVYLDLSNLSDLSALPKVEVVFICAAISTKLGCIENPELAFQVNVIAPTILARYFLDQGSRVIYLSSSAVFHGSDEFACEESQTSPITEYGRLKALAENFLLDGSNNSSDQLVIVRPTKIFSSKASLIAKWIERLRLGMQIEAFEHVLIAPISLQYLINALDVIGMTHATGIFHLSGGEELSFYEFAKRLTSEIGVDHRLVSPSKNLNSNDPTPIHALLKMDRTKKMLNLMPQSNNDILKDLLK